MDYEPSTIEGFCQTKFYSYSASMEEIMTFVLQWLKEHPEVTEEDIFVGSDEGTWVTIYWIKYENQPVH